MRLSVEAKGLLDANKIHELVALPVERLLHPDDFSCCIAYGKHPETAPATFLELAKPVVVSNGHIYPRDTVVELLKESEFKCPETHETLSRDLYGRDGAKGSFVRLPAIDGVIDYIKKLKHIHDAILALAGLEDKFSLQLKVSREKLRVVILPVDGSDLTVLKGICKACLPSPLSEIPSGNDVLSYSVKDFGRCWGIMENSELRLEFWFPSSELTDEEANAILGALLQPLSLPGLMVPSDTTTGSIKVIPAREYRDAFPHQILSARDIAACCASFMQYTVIVAGDRKMALNDIVRGASVPAVEEALHGGLMLFKSGTRKLVATTTSDSILESGNPSSAMPSSSTAAV